jgi:hypothetical protein
MVTYDAIDRHHSDHRPGPRAVNLSELCGFVFPCNEAAFEAMLDGVAERGGGGLTSAE